jgi:hypothetical protein
VHLLPNYGSPAAASTARRRSEALWRRITGLAGVCSFYNDRRRVAGRDRILIVLVILPFVVFIDELLLEENEHVSAFLFHLV